VFIAYKCALQRARLPVKLFSFGSLQLDCGARECFAASQVDGISMWPSAKYNYEHRVLIMKIYFCNSRKIYIHFPTGIKSTLMSVVLN
jgi:hypothetical protein